MSQEQAKLDAIRKLIEQKAEQSSHLLPVKVWPRDIRVSAADILDIIDGEPRITLTRAVQTCYACPSQWDAWDADENYYYLRYRWGVGTVERDHRVIAEFDTGDSLDGSIDLAEFARRAGLRLAKGVS